MKNRNKEKLFDTINKLIERHRCDNPALLYNKLLPFISNFNSLEKGNFKKIDVLNSFYEKLQTYTHKYNPIEALKPKLCFTAKTAYRLAIGMGYPSLIENGLLFHHVYGIPYIPGETLKGLARSVFLLSVYEAIKEKKELSLNDLEEAFLPEEEFVKALPKVPILFEAVEIEKPYEFFQTAFGTQEKRGEVIFFDAFPENFNPKEHLVIDIMNPHYAEYYTTEGKEPPADWYDPRPIHFLAVAEGVSFKICLDYALLGKPKEGILELVKLLLKVGLENFGVGNKKRKGYGWFY